MTEQSSIVFIYHIAFIYCSVICLWAFKFMHCHGYYNSTIHMETQVTLHGTPFIMTFFFPLKLDLSLEESKSFRAKFGD